MTAKLDEAIRAVWTDAYSFHERYCDMDGTDLDWIKTAKVVYQIVNKHQGAARRLSELLMMAVYDFLSEEQVKREDEERNKPLQISIGDIPWT